MTDFIGSAGFDYEALEAVSTFGNDADYAMDDLRELVSAAFPDNSRDARITDIEAAVRIARVNVRLYLNEVERLIAIAKEA